MKILLTILSILLASACGNHESTQQTNSANKTAQLSVDEEVCQLDQPVELSHSPFEQSMAYSDIVFDQVVKQQGFASNGKNPPTKLFLFPINGRRDEAHFLGARFESQDDASENSSIGFSDGYFGSVHVEGDKHLSRSETVYTTVERFQNFKDKKLTLKVDHDKIVSVSFSYPLTETIGAYDIPTGEEQTLCVKSMRLR